MKILLDSCALVDIAIGASSLTEEAKALFEDTENEIFVSSASIWELGLKKSLGKLDFDVDGAVALFSDLGIKVLDVTLSVVLLVNKLPYHHKDPFDRVIIATAKQEGMTVVTSDAVFADYALDIILSR